MEIISESSSVVSAPTEIVTVSEVVEANWMRRRWSLERRSLEGRWWLVEPVVVMHSWRRHSKRRFFEVWSFIVLNWGREGRRGIDSR